VTTAVHSLTFSLLLLPCLLDAAEFLLSQFHIDNRWLSYLQPIENFSFFPKKKNHHIHSQKEKWTWGEQESKKKDSCVIEE
jgi:hypothetical protein